MMTEHVVGVAVSTIEISHKLPVEALTMIQRNSNKSVWLALQNAHEMLLEMRPGDRSPTDRHYAVSITEMEKVMAYFRVFVLDGYAGETPITTNEGEHER